MHCDMLFIHPSAHPCSPQFIVMPMGIISIMNQLQDYTVEAINVGLELCLDNTFDLEEFVREHDFNFVGIDLHWHEHAYTSLETARLCKEINPDCIVILGGFTASYFAEEILEYTKDIDIIVTGEAEEAVRCILQGESLSKIPNLVYRASTLERTPPAPSSSLDYNFSNITKVHHWEEYLKTSIHAFVKRRFWYDFWLCTGRGCTYNCSYCGGASSAQKNLLGRNKIVFRPIDAVIEDLAYLQDLGVHVVCPSHDISLSRAYWEELFARMKQEHIDMGMYLEVWQLPDREFIEALAEVCDPRFSTLAITLLSGCESVRRQNGKYFSNKDYRKCIQTAEESRMNHIPYFATGLPFETTDTFDQTLAMTETLITDYCPSGIFCTPLRLDPGSPMYENPDHFKIIKHFFSFKDYYERCKKRAQDLPYDPTGYHTAFLDARTIMKMQSQWEAVVRSNPVMSGGSLDRLHFV